MNVKEFLPALTTAALLCPVAGAQVLCDWDFSGLLNPGIPDGPVTNPLIDAADAALAPGLATSGLIAVAGQPSYTGLLWASSTMHGELNHKFWDGDKSDPGGTAHDGVSDNWIAFTLTNTQGAPQQLERLSVSAWRNGSGAPGRYAFEVVVDGGSAQPFGVVHDDLAVGDGTFDWFHFDGALQFVSSLEVRFRPVALPGGQGTGNLHINGLRVEAAAGSGGPSGPNVLFLIADDLAPGALGCYGNTQVITPNIDALASRGLVFDRAYCQYPVCAAARASLGTGLYPARIKALGGGYEQFDAAIGSHPTLPEHFRLEGYTTARVSKFFHQRVPGDITSGSSGPDHAPSWTTTYNVMAPEWKTPGPANHYTNENLIFDHNQHYNLGFGTAFYTVEGSLSGAEQADVLAADEAIALLGQLKDEPFFLAVGFVRPHVPLVAPQAIYDLYDPDLMQLADSVAGDLGDIPSAGVYWDEPVRGPWTDDARRHVLRGYYATVTFMDQQVGRVLDRLEELGLDENTIVVFTSDHGYHLGEHTMWQKLSLHEESARVPLIVQAPGIDDGRTTRLAELVDLYPTLAELAGLETPVGAQGISLRPMLEDPTVSVRETVLSSVSGGHLLRTESWAYMRYGDGSEELYDMAPTPLGDPLQFTNLAGDPAYTSVRQELSDTLDDRLVAAAGDAGTGYCFGDGSGVDCPCLAFGGPGEGCLNSSGQGATLEGGGMPSLTSDAFTLTVSGGPPGQPGLLFQGLAPMAAPFGSGILCTNPQVRLPVQFLDQAGSTRYTSLAGNALHGTTLYYQYWFRDPTGSCPGGFNLSNAWHVLWR